MKNRTVWTIRIVLLIFLVLLIISFINMLGIPNPFYNPFSRPAAIPKPVTIVDSELSSDEQNVIEVYKRFSPSVVFIANAANAGNRFSLNITQIPRGTGSGFIWDHDGHIVTNYHVIEGASSIIVRLQDQSNWRAHVVGTDIENDIAVIRVGAPPNKLQPVIIADATKLQVGQRVIAIGNPFGLDTTLTVGFISALGRQITTEAGWHIDGLIQTDAAINPGNSGGPLLDSFGRVVGVNTAILSPSGTSSGIGFSVPIDTVNEIVPLLISNGKVPYPFLGVRVLPPHMEELFQEEGMVIGGIVENSPADKASLQGITRTRQGDRVNDVIIAINDEPVTNGDGLVKILRRNYKPGDIVTLSVKRQNKVIEVEVRLEVK